MKILDSDVRCAVCMKPVNRCECDVIDETELEFPR